MISRLKHRLPGVNETLLNRLIIWSAALLVLAIAAFAVYYYLDQRGGQATSAAERETARYEQAARDDPQNLSVRLALAEVYYNNKRYRDSADQYQAALIIEEESTLALVGLGRALLATGDTTGATGNFQKVLDRAKEADIDGQLVEAAHYYLGSMSLDQQRPDEAIAHLKQAVAMERTDADALYLLGAAYTASGDLDTAISTLSQAVLFVPDFAEAYEKLAIAYDGKGLIPEAQYARGMLSYSQGRLEEAAVQLQAAIDASGDLPVAYAGLGMVRESQGQRGSALAAYQQALQLEPDNFNARAGLARLGAPAAPSAATPQGVTP